MDAICHLTYICKVLGYGCTSTEGAGRVVIDCWGKLGTQTSDQPVGWSTYKRSRTPRESCSTILPPRIINGKEPGASSPDRLDRTPCIYAACWESRRTANLTASLRDHYHFNSNATTFSPSPPWRQFFHTPILLLFTSTVTNVSDDSHLFGLV